MWLRKWQKPAPAGTIAGRAAARASLSCGPKKFSKFPPPAHSASKQLLAFRPVLQFIGVVRRLFFKCT